MKTIELRLADTLHHEADGLPDAEVARVVPAAPHRPHFLRPGFAAPVAVLAVMVLAAPLIWLSTQRSGGGSAVEDPSSSQPATSQPTHPGTTAVPSPTFTGLLGEIVDLLPTGFNPETAIPVFVGEGSVEQVVADYIEARHLTTDAGIAQVEEQDGYTLAQWAWGQLIDNTAIEPGLSGWLLMRPTDGGLEILAATTEGVDLSDLAISDGNLGGSVETDTAQTMGVDVLDLDGTPVESSPNPEGMPDADMVWGTAAAGDPPLTLDLAVTEPFVVRVNLVGGALLSISEVAFGQAEADVEEVTMTTTTMATTTTPDTERVAAIAAELGGSAMSQEKLKLITGLESDMAYSGYLIDSTTTPDGSYELGLIVYEEDLPTEEPMTCFTSYAITQGVNVAGGGICGLSPESVAEIAAFDVLIGGSCGGVPKEEPVVEGVWTLLTVWGIPETADTVIVRLSDGSTVDVAAPNGVAHYIWEASVGIESLEFAGMSAEQRDRAASYLPAPGIDC